MHYSASDTYFKKKKKKSEFSQEETLYRLRIIFLPCYKIVL